MYVADELGCSVICNLSNADPNRDAFERSAYKQRLLGIIDDDTRLVMDLHGLSDVYGVSVDIGTNPSSGMPFRSLRSAYPIVGPIAYDYGTMLGILVLAFLAQPYLNPGNTHIQSDIMTGVRDMWQAFSGELARQCDIASRDDMAFSSFLSSVEYDSIGYAACELADMAWGRTTPSEVASLSDEQRALVTKDAALAIMSMMGRMMTMDDLLGCLSSHVER